MTRRGFLAVLPLVGPAAVAAVRAVEPVLDPQAALAELKALRFDGEEWAWTDDIEPMDYLIERSCLEPRAWRWNDEPLGHLLNLPEARMVDGDPLGE